MPTHGDVWQGPKNEWGHDTPLDAAEILHIPSKTDQILA